MAPILGIYASQISGHLFAPSGAYDSIATATVGAGGSSSIDFNSIPSTYTHLQIRYLIRSGGTNNDFSFGINGSFSIANSSAHILKGDGSSATASALSSQNFISFANTISASLPSGQLQTGIIDILDYANTNKTKTVRHLFGSDQNGSGYVILGSGMLNTTSAITAVNLFNGYNWAQYSSFALYGIKGN